MDLIETLRARRAALKAELEVLTALAEGESRGFNDTESAEFDAKLEEMRKLDARVDELVEADKRESAAAEVRKEIGSFKAMEGVTSEPNPVYRKQDTHGPSFFRDMFKAQVRGDVEARGRLASAQETRAGDMTSVAGAGGEFAPPLWLIEDFVALARPGRVFANLANQNELPSGISSINLPKVATGATVAVQASQNTAVSDTAMTTTSVSTSITTIAGKQIVAMQLLEQSGIPFDRVILGDLARAYAAALDTQVITGTGAGGNLSGVTNTGVGTKITWTTTQPAVYSATAGLSFYSQVAYAIEQVQTNRYLAPNVIVMHPRRWTWVLEAGDTTGRPLVTPNGLSYNSVGTFGSTNAEGIVGEMLGLAVAVDPNIPTNLGAATNQDQVFILRSDDLELWESPLQTASFDATYADQASILFRVLGYAGFIGNRYSASVQYLDGTGLTVPTLH